MPWPACAPCRSISSLNEDSTATRSSRLVNVNIYAFWTGNSGICSPGAGKDLPAGSSCEVDSVR